MQPKFIKSLIERKQLARAAQHISPVGVTLFVIFAITAVQGAAWFNRRLSDSLIETWVVVWMLIAVYLLFAVKVASQWEKVIVLRLGKFQGLKGPGLFWIIPIIDSTAAWIDHRVNVTPFSAEKTLTKDTVPVDGDAELHRIIDERTTPWGVTVSSVEIRDIVIPQDLEDAMSRQAQAERERQARVILGESERQIADSFAEASKSYINR